MKPWSVRGSWYRYNPRRRLKTAGCCKQCGIDGVSDKDSSRARHEKKDPEGTTETKDSQHGQDPLAKDVGSSSSREIDEVYRSRENKTSAVSTMRRTVKGNRKGWTRSYRLQRLFFLTSAILLLFLVAITTRFIPLNNNGEVSNSFFGSAAEVQVTADGEQVGDSRGGSDSKERHQLDDFPILKYGTAWKEERTYEYVYNAVMAGFRHVDTACQPRHYQEPLVGKAWTAAAKELGLERFDFWLQTKFTSVDGQDPDTIPYDPDAPLNVQVQTSLETSLRNLQTTYLDSWLMHGPEASWEDNLLVWKTMESFVQSGQVRQIGISNFYNVDAVEYLFNQATVKPAVVQNRFYADSNYDVEIRTFCRDHDMEYQSFWTLGANYHALHHDQWLQLAESKALTPETLMYAFCLSIGISPLDGTKSQLHLQQDMDLVRRIQKEEEILNPQEIELCSNLLGIPKEEASREEQ